MKPVFHSHLFFLLFLLAVRTPDAMSGQPEIIHGHVLPPEPDPKINNTTLLGIDSNHNGVRDDVERWVIKRYADEKRFPRAKTAIALQYAKAAQIVIQTPEKAYENRSFEYLNNAEDCAWYLLESREDRVTFEEIRIFDAEFKDHVFNTKLRLLNYTKFNAALSGHTFAGPVHYSVDACDTNIDAFHE